MDPDSRIILFDATIQTGYAFRQDIEHIAKFAQEIQFCIIEDGILIRKGNGTRTHVVDIFLDGTRLFDFYFNEHGAIGEEKMHVINLNISWLMGYLKTIKTGGKVRVMRYADDEDVHFIDPMGDPTAIKQSNSEDIYRIDEDWDISEDKPVCNIMWKDLKDIVKSVCKNKNKCTTNVVFEVYSNWIKFKAQDPNIKNEHNIFSSPRGNLSSEKLYEVVIKMNSFSYLDKLNCLTKEGQIALYCKSNDLIVLDVQGNYIGRKVVYLVSEPDV